MRPNPSIQVNALVNRRRNRQSRQLRSLLRRAQRLGLGLLALIFVLAALATWAAAALYTSLTAGLPPVQQVASLLDPGSGPFLQPTRFYDRSGQHLLLTLENPGIPRRYLKADPAEPDHFSPELVRVTIALIDPTFWKNPGFLLANLTNPQPATIAERLASDLLLSQEPPGLRRALRMRILAAELVSQVGRPKVLEWFLNSAYFGRLSFGAESAARLYFDKSATDLTLAESAMLVPLMVTPALNPLDAPTAALERQKAALAVLFSQGTISADEEQRANQAALNLRKTSPQNGSLAPAFTSLALDQAAQRFGRLRLERGGLRITTTLDFELQQQVVCLVATQLARLEGHESQAALADGSPCEAARLLPTLPAAAALPEGLAASAVVLDPRSGQVLALLGDTTLAGGEASALLPHAPGSLLTPFAAVAAFARGYGPASLVWDVPDAQSSATLARLTASDYHGPLRLRQAIANDILTPQASLVDHLGAANVWQLATNLGLQGLSEERSSAVLYGGARLTPLEVAAGYSVFANLGSVYGQRDPVSAAVQPTLVRYVEDIKGQVWFDGAQSESQSLLSTPLAYLVHNVLSDEPARWPSLGFPNPLEIGRPAGAKVGQASAGRDGWAVGYTPQRLAAVWLGLPEDAKAKIDLRQSAAVWHALIQYTSRDLPAEDWPVPAGISKINVCDPSGMLPTPNCPAVVSEVFLNGNEPVSTDNLYRSVQINRETGRLATVFTPPALVEDRVYLMVPPEARTWAQATGQAIAPEIYDVLQPPAPSADVRISTPAMFGYVRGQVEIRGSAAGSGFVSYSLQAGEGLNPQSWTQIGQENHTAVQDGSLGRWDTSKLDGLYALRLVVVRSDNRVENAILQVTIDNTPPEARVVYPLNGQEYPAVSNQQITFQASAEDAVGISSLEWVLDGKVIGQSKTAPYSLTWTAQPGEHKLLVRALDMAGNLAESVPVQFSDAR